MEYKILKVILPNRTIYDKDCKKWDSHNKAIYLHQMRNIEFHIGNRYYIQFGTNHIHFDVYSVRQ